MPGPNRDVTHTERWFHGVTAALLVGVFAASFGGLDLVCGHDVGDQGANAFTICFLRAMTGIPCPTCGMTRSFCTMGRGDVVRAAGLHPLGPATFALFAFLLVRSAGIALGGRDRFPRAAALLVRAIPYLVVLWVLVWAVRLAAMVADGSASAAWHASPLGRLIGR